MSASIAIAVEKRLDDRIVDCRVRNLQWHLDLNELIDHSVFYLGTHERFTTRRVLEGLPRDGVLFDIGANIGYFTLLGAKKVGPHGHVYAFEPMARAMSKLARHVGTNKLENVTLVKAVLTDRSRGPVEIAFKNSWPLYEKAEQDSTSESVPTVTLDEYVDEHRVQRMDVLKIDVDGFEFKVLSGGTKALGLLRPRVVIELGKYTLRQSGDRLRDLLKLLDDAHYRFYSERTMRRFASIAEIEDKVPENSTINVVCMAARKR